MQSVKAIVKIDLVSSKARYDLKPANRTQFIAELTTTAQNFFQNLSETFPKGNFYSAQGDCIWVICDTPTIAVRNSIEFQKHWATKLKVFPDCRIVLDVGEIEDTIIAGKLELLGAPFENISVLEKEFGSGDVGLTEAAKDMVDKSLVHFKDFGEIQICSTRKIKAFKAEYKDPRSLRDTELFHAIFVAPTTSDEVRSKAVEAFFVSHLHHNPNEKLSLATVNNLLVTKGFSKIDLIYFKKLVQNSQFLEIEGDEKHCVLRANFANEIEKIATTFYSEKRKTIEILSSSLADSLDVPISTIQSWVGDLLEDYLSAVFLEIRMLASFYTSTQVLFEKLAISREFDYVIRNHVPKSISCSTERFSYFKSSFLRSLLKVISLSKRYFAAIFHSVLMLYYLNRTKYSTALIDKFANKQIFLDTSVLYSYLCRASDFHEMVKFFVTQLQSLGVEICVFDKSIDEYHDSLNHAASVFKSGVRDPRTFLDGGSSWIRKEFNDHSECYTSFDYCINVHKLCDEEITLDNFEQVKEKVKERGLSLVRLDPYKSKEDLGGLYDELYKAKKKFNPETNFAEIQGSEKAYECRVLHDANCLSFLQCNVNTPLDAKNVFVTSDFRLGKIRRQFTTQYEFVLNVLEFYEFILPYLFMSGLIEGNPVEAPNLLLASALSAELNQEEEFDARLKSVLLSEEEIHHQYEILASGACKERLLNVRQRMSKYSEVKSDAEKAKCFDDFTSLTGELLRLYMNEIKSSTAKELTSLKISEDAKEIERMKAEIENLKTVNAKLLIKKRRRDKYGKKK